MGEVSNITPDELILNDTPKDLPLVTSHHNEVLTCSSLLHRVRHFPHDRSYICSYLYFNWAVIVTSCSVEK